MIQMCICGKSNMKISSLKAMFGVKTNFNITCEKFYEKLIKK